MQPEQNLATFTHNQNNKHIISMNTEANSIQKHIKTGNTSDTKNCNFNYTK